MRTRRLKQGLLGLTVGGLATYLYRSKRRDDEGGENDDPKAVPDQRLYTIGTNADVHESAVIGHPYRPDAGRAVIGDGATIRSGTTIYADVSIGDDFTTGHAALVRESTTIGDRVVLGTNAVIDGETTVGSDVSMQTGVYVPTNTTIGDNVFLGPKAVLTNDPYPVRRDAPLSGPTVEEGVSIGANATILPGVTIGENSFVAAGALVAEDVPENTLAIGVPAHHESLPDPLQGANTI